MRYNALNHMTAKNLGAGKHADGQGLWLVKREKAFGKWVLRVAVHGSRREMGLGRWPDVSISTVPVGRWASAGGLTCRS